MMLDLNYWKNIEYLRNGNSKQRLAYDALCESNILTLLKEFDPLVIGTIPIEIDIESSDIDICCYATDLLYLQSIVRASFEQMISFRDKYDNLKYVASFEYGNLEFEVYAEDKPSHLQYGFRHMLIEYRILNLLGLDFKNKIIQLKNSGLKTEPAFGVLLNLSDPYIDLLKLEELSDIDLKKALSFK